MPESAKISGILEITSPDRQHECRFLCNNKASEGNSLVGGALSESEESKKHGHERINIEEEGQEQIRKQKSE